MPSCAQCGGHVSTEYRRVFAVEGVVPGCPACDSPAAR